MMADGIDEAVIAFSQEVAPQVAPRDQKGQFIAKSERAEPMFGPRTIEGDPLTGDTRDGGDDARLRALEREVADGRLNEESRRSTSDGKDLRRSTGDEGHERGEGEQEDIWAILAEDGDGIARADEVAPSERRDAKGEPVGDAEAGPRYEITADGETLQVTLEEALRGYTRTATFHKRLAQLNQAQGELEGNINWLQQGWAAWQKARADYEEDLATLLPQEPNWDQEFARDPHAAHAQQKIFQILYGKLAQSRQLRAQREQAAQAENDRRVQKYAVDGFSKFVMDNKIPDEPSLQKQLQSMRRTAKAAGFSDYEVATVYDPRMLSVLLKASKYDRMMAARPRAVIPGKGRTLTPGAATPLNGNGPRKSLDEALRRQASSGRLDDTAEVFRRLL
jgi:hypothetical protein